MEQKHPVNELLAGTIEKIKEAVDANTVVGTPIQAGEVTLIPVSKLSFGFGTGGSEFGKGKPSGELPFGGGGGAGVKITPVCFLVVKGDSVRALPMNPPAESSVDRLIELLPDAISKVSDFISKKKSSDFVDEDA